MLRPLENEALRSDVDAESPFSDLSGAIVTPDPKLHREKKKTNTRGILSSSVAHASFCSFHFP
jgi:hypothetical protein